jgi:hypothetical protein
VASTSEELLDLFEDRCVLLEERASPTSPNDDRRASERPTKAAPNGLTSAEASSTELSAPATGYPVYRSEFVRDLGKK